MKIFDITINNYRGIRRLEQLPIHNLNTFVGENDSGKSSVIYALNAFFNGSFDQGDICKYCGEDEKCSVQIRFKIDQDVPFGFLDSQGLLSLRKTFSYNEKGRLVTDYEYNCLDSSADVGNVWQLKESALNKHLERLEIEYSKSGAGVTNAKKIEQIITKLSGEESFENLYPVKDLFKNLSNANVDVSIPKFTIFDADSNLDESSTAFQSAFKSIAIEAIDSEKDKTEALELSIQQKLHTEFQLITGLMKKNVPDIESIDPQINLNWGNLTRFDLALKFVSDDEPIPLSKKGTGFRRLLMVAYFEYAASKNSERHIYAIEEPETFLHPRLQSTLLSSIQNLSDENQFFITTHSTIFAGASSANSITVVTQPDNKCSKYEQPATEDEILDRVINVLGIRPDLNLFSGPHKHILFGEGSGDVGFYKAYARSKGLTWFDEVLVVPCGGDQVDFFVNKKLCKALSRRFTLVVDSDKQSADDTSKSEKLDRLRQEVENDGGKFFVLERRTIENYYHTDAIDRYLESKNKDKAGVTISPFCKVPDVFKNSREIVLGNIKHKNNLDIFQAMTASEWDEVSTTTSGDNELQKIFDHIHSVLEP